MSELLVKPYTSPTAPRRLGDRVFKVLQRSERRKAAELATANAARQAVGDAAAALATATPTVEEDERLTILTVDDTPDNLRLISRVFEDNYRVRLAHNGEKALAIWTYIAARPAAGRDDARYGRL